MINKLNNIKDAIVSYFKRINFKKIKVKLLGNGYRDGLLIKIFIYVLLILISFVFLQPLLEMLLGSFRSKDDCIDPEIFYIARNPTFDNYILAVSDVVLDFAKTLWNSVWFSLVLAILQTIVTALTGYVFARYKFKFKGFWFALLIAAFLIPVPVVTAPRTMIFLEFDGFLQSIFDPNQTRGESYIYGTAFPQIILSMLGQGVNSTVLILICYNFFKQIPYELDEASVMDGATSFQTFYHIIFKLSAPVIFTVFLFAFVWNWNDTFSTSYYFSKLITLPYQMTGFEALLQANTITEATEQAATLLAILPLIILYAFVQKRFVEGIEQTGMTGQ